MGWRATASPTINAEIGRDEIVGWLRNSDRKRWSLTIPYERKPGRWAPVFPDFLFFRLDGEKVQIDILDPHGVHLPEVSKAVGLSLVAEDQGPRFGRIQLIDKIDGSCSGSI